MNRSNHRVVGLDVHPDSFAGAILEGSDPWQARVKSTSTRVALRLLEKWALRHTRESDCLVLESSANAFAVAERLGRLKRKVLILDSHRAGKVGQSYCATDRVDAIKIARIYLSALSPIVWQPDQKTRERREVFSAYQAVVKEGTRLKQQIKSMLNEHCVRLEKGFRLSHPTAIERLLQRRKWTEAQKMLLEQLHAGLVGARSRGQQPAAKVGPGHCPAPRPQQSRRGRGAQTVRGGVARDARPRHRRDRAIRHPPRQTAQTGYRSGRARDQSPWL